MQRIFGALPRPYKLQLLMTASSATSKGIPRFDTTYSGFLVPHHEAIRSACQHIYREKLPPSASLLHALRDISLWALIFGKLNEDGATVYPWVDDVLRADDWAQEEDGEQTGLLGVASDRGEEGAFCGLVVGLVPWNRVVETDFAIFGSEAPKPYTLPRHEEEIQNPRKRVVHTEFPSFESWHARLPQSRRLIPKSAVQIAFSRLSN
ncbi:hypothetical protein B0I35DRAFT_472536 [Stachybotrys elegans]|uniref:Uncharacterized protein n=1 Tax=Stachybotrys elegans TaxID=80388 RepID=A0A8K0WW32_9HYPO|nr:hypothetical protein B0I35DRAFT_472536 [Stachybotrys elegans]